jgi:hypothetical protein
MPLDCTSARAEGLDFGPVRFQPGGLPGSLRGMREEKAQAKLRKTVARMEAVRDLLRRIYENVPASPREEVMLLGEAEPDVATEVRSVIECVLADRIEPAIQALAEAAAYRPKGKG